jgi:phage protein D
MTPASAAYAPAYRLTINGVELPESVRSYITAIRYEDGRDGSDQVMISLANADLTFLQTHIRGLTVVPPLGISVNNFLGAGSVGASLFDMDSQVELALGYSPGPLTDLFTGEITGVAAEFPNGGMPTLTITAHDFLQRTMRGTVSRGFGPLPDAAVVAILGLENGLLPLLDPYMIPLDVINTIGNFLFGTGTKQIHQSDFCLLSEIAQRFDVGVSVNGRVLYLSRFIDREYTPRMTLTYGQSLLEFAPRVSTVGQAIGVTQRVSLREIRVDLILKVFWDLDREAVGVLVLPAEAAVLAPALGSPAVESKQRTIRNAIDIANTVVSLIGQLRKKLNNRLTGTGSAVGDPQIRAAAMIALNGLGADFSDVYRVTKAVHMLDAEGYRTQFEVQKEILL